MKRFVLLLVLGVALAMPAVAAAGDCGDCCDCGCVSLRQRLLCTVRAHPACDWLGFVKKSPSADWPA